MQTETTAYFRRRRHEWINWANEEHGLMRYTHDRQAEIRFRQFEKAIRRKYAVASKRMSTPRRTPAKKKREQSMGPNHNLPNHYSTKLWAMSHGKRRHLATPLSLEAQAILMENPRTTSAGGFSPRAPPDPHIEASMKYLALSRHLTLVRHDECRNSL